MEPHADAWTAAYREGRTPWDLRGVTPALAALAERGGLGELGLPRGARAAVPGCGRGHDLRILAGHRLAVTGFDVVPEAVAEARALLRLNRTEAEVLCRDVLGLLPEYEGMFDLVYEYTCFCALRPHLRRAYAEVVNGLLAPGGCVLALIFPMVPELAGDNGPPYLVTEEAAAAAFAPALRLERSFAPEGTDDPRAGAQRWYVWRKP